MTIENNQHKELLRKSELMKETFQSDCNDYFLLLNTKLKIVSYNLCAANFFNQQLQQNLQPGKGILGYLKLLQFEPLKQMFQKAKEGITLQQEILINDSTSNSWIRFTVSPALNHKNEIVGIACIGCNVHKEKTQEEKIKTQRSVLTQIAQIYSHQIRHPLTNIMAIIDLIKCEDFKMTKKYLGFLEMASKELDGVIRSVVLDSATAA